MSGLQFLRPYWLLALPIVAVALFWWWRGTVSGSPWQRVCDPALLTHLLVGRPQQRRWLHFGWGLAATLAIVALAGPAWHKLPSPTFSSQSALVILLDASQSMNATDLSPNRITRARHKALDILARRRDGYTALIAFAAEPFTVTPLTQDTATIAALVPSISVEIMPSQGSRPDKALQAARDLLRQAGFSHGHVVVITDGSSGSSLERRASDMRQAGYQVSVLGVGTAEGAPVPTSYGFLSSTDGAIVIPKLESSKLQRAALAGGGVYATLTVDDRDIDRLLAATDRGADFELNETSSEAATRWREEGPWLLLLVAPLAALAFRRGAVLCLAAAIGIGISDPAAATGWRDLWQTPDQQGKRALQSGDASRAAELFEDPAWRGTAQFEKGDFPAAAETFAKLTDVEADYNRGNALARGGEFDEALAAYKQVLDRKPEHADARHNYDLLKELLKQQQTQQQQSKSGDSEDSGKDTDRDQSNQGQQNQQQNGDNQQRGEQSQRPQDQQSGTDDPQQSSSEDDESAAQPNADLQNASGEDQQRTESAALEEEGSDEEPQQLSARESDDDLDADPAIETWLRRIPDDPGGLLRRKFLYQYKQRPGTEQESEPW
jgi:Ca-activated chloride channel family protein